MKKKFLAFLLAVVMVMTMLPTVAFAAEPTEIDEINMVLNNRGLAGKTWGEVRDSIVSIPNNPDNLTIDNLQLADFNDGEDGNPILWGDSDEITPGKYYLSVVFKAPAGSYFKNKPDEGIEHIPYTRIEDDGLELNISGNNTIKDKSEVSVSPIFDYEPIGEYFLRIENRICGDGNIDTEYKELETRIAKYNERKYDVIYNSIIIVFDVRENDLSSDQSEIKGVITAADFAYEMIIPSDTLLTEDNHKDVLLGNDGKVSIEVTKHAVNGIDIYYTVDLTNGKLTDGTHDIATTYGFSEDGIEFDDVTAEAEYTVYTGGEAVDTYINVTADGDDWDAAPVGDYNATVVFNFDRKPTSNGVTIDDVFPKDLRVGTTVEMSTPAFAYYDAKAFWMATVIKPDSDLSAMYFEETGVDVGNMFMISGPGILLPITTELTPIDGGYRCITPCNESSFDWAVDFMMEGNTLSKIVLSAISDGEKQKVSEMTYDPGETKTVAEIAGEVSGWTAEEPSEYKFIYENGSLNLYQNEEVIKTLPGTSTLYFSPMNGGTWLYPGDGTIYAFLMSDSSLNYILMVEGTEEIAFFPPES